MIAAILKAYPKESDNEADGIPGNAMPLEQRRSDYDEPKKKETDPIVDALSQGKPNTEMVGPSHESRGTS